MESVKSPQRKSTEYHFCIRVTPKVLSKAIFQSKGIESLYKLQLYKGSKKQTVETMRRNLHHEALEGFYRSQNCYFTLLNYTNFHPYEMKITFSEVNSSNQEEIIFTYKFSTYGVVKNFLENDVRRLTHTITKDFETEFYIDFYIQNNKARLEEKVKRDSNKHILNRKHFRQTEDDEKDSDILRKSVVSNNSPSKSSHRDFSTVSYRLQKNMYTRSSTPLVNAQSTGKRRSFLGENFDDARSEKLSQNRSRKHASQTLNIETYQGSFFKKYPSTRLYVDSKNDDKQDSVPGNPIFENLKQNKSNFSSKLSDKNTAKYQKTIKKGNENGKKQKEFDLQVFLNMKEMSLDEISYQIKKNIILIIFISIIFFIVTSRAIDSVNSNDNRIQKSENFELSQDEDVAPKREKRQNPRKKTSQRERKMHIHQKAEKSVKLSKKEQQSRRIPLQIKRI